MNRRDFVKTTAAGAIALHTAPALGQSEAQFPTHRPGHVVKVSQAGALSTPVRVNSAPRAEVVEVMGDTALLAFTELGDIATAWRRFVAPDDRVMIKINCLGSPNMATNEAVVYAVVRGLLAAGHPTEQMLIYDQYRSRMARAHFRVGSDVMGVPIEYSRTRGHMDDATAHGSGESRFCRALEWATAVINIPVIKDHDACGVTMSMKNMTHGTIDNPSTMHRHNCNPSIPDIYNTEMIRPKVRVVVADGLRVMYDGGPQDNANKVLHNAVYVATDPVAVDTVALDVVEATRRAHGLGSLDDDGRPCNWLGMAESMGLGIHARERITLEPHALS